MTSERRDHLRKVAAQADAYEPKQLDALFKELGIKSPSTGADLTEAFPFNLMFQTSIGPTGQVAGFLRPETAQGMFVNFRRLYDYNCQRMPMAVAQIGSAYRNEIAPRGGLIRVREFTMAEIEHFVHPERKDHAKFGSVAEQVLNLFPAENQVGDGKTIATPIGAAVARGLVNNQTLGYFMARTAQFLHALGINPAGLRFRQHLRTEMAHYACDCWDAEVRERERERERESGGGVGVCAPVAPRRARRTPSLPSAQRKNNNNNTQYTGTRARTRANKHTHH
jgi:glycyl-tRNA synthetase